MNLKPILVVLVLVAFAAALALAFLPDDEGGVPIPAAPAEVGGASDGQPAAGAVVSGPGTAASGPSTAAVRVEADGGAGVAGARGGGRAARIRGRLVGSAAQPMPNLELSYSTWRNDSGLDFDFLPGRSGSRPQQELRTAADGSFEFLLPSDQSARLELPSMDFVFDERPSPIHGHKGDQDLGAIAVARAATLAGTVQDERGAPVAGVNVRALQGVWGFSATSSSVTDDDGRFRLGKIEPGSWTLRTASAHHMPTMHELQVEEAAAVEGIVLTVAPGQGIAGQVVDDLGRPVADVKVGAKRAEAHGGVDIERFSDDESTTTDDNGMFALSGLEGESATVRAHGGGYTTAVAPDVKVGTGNLVLSVDRLATVAGVLQASDGAPLADSRVRATTAERGDRLAARGIESIVPGGWASATTAADGSFRIENVSPGEVSLVAEGADHRPARRAGIRVAPGQVVEDVRLVANRGATAVVTVLDDRGEPVEGARVRADAPSADGGGGPFAMRGRRIEREAGAVRVFDGTESLGSAETDADGVATIRGLRDGAVVFRASHPDFADSAPLSLPLLANGTVEVELTLRVPGWAELTVTHADSGEPVVGASYVVRQLGSGTGEQKSGKTDEQGMALVGPLATGNYTAELQRAAGGMRVGGAMMITLDGEGGAIEGTEARFVVSAGQTTLVALQRPVLARIFGVVTGADGPVAECVVELQKEDPERPVISGMGGGRSVTTEADGTFAIDDVEPGDYVVEYGRVDQLVKATAKLSVAPGTPERRLDLALRTGVVRVQVWSTTTGAPVAGAEVQLRRARPGGGGDEPRDARMVMVSVVAGGASGSGDSTMMTFGMQRAKTDATGWAEIEDVPVGEYELEVTDERHSARTVDGVVVAELQTTEVGRVDLAQAGRIRGKVVDNGGGQVQMALVFHRPIAGEEGQPVMAMNGSFAVDALPPGRHVLRAQALALGGGGPGAFGPEVEVEVVAGGTATVELRLPPN